METVSMSNETDHIHRTFLATMGGHPGCVDTQAACTAQLLCQNLFSILTPQKKTSFKNKDFEALVSTSDSANLYTFSRSCHQYRGGVRTTVLEVR